MPRTRKEFPPLIAKAAAFATGTHLGLPGHTGQTVSVAIDFGTPRYPGEQLFLFHCHNLKHEDQGMVLNVKVV